MELSRALGGQNFDSLEKSRKLHYPGQGPDRDLQGINGFRPRPECRTDLKFRALYEFIDSGPLSRRNGGAKKQRVSTISLMFLFVMSLIDNVVLFLDSLAL
jgi:hypothetical protein